MRGFFVFQRAFIQMPMKSAKFFNFPSQKIQMRLASNKISQAIRISSVMNTLRISNLFDPFLLSTQIDEGAGSNTLVEWLIDLAIELDGRNIGLHLVCTRDPQQQQR